MSKETPFVLDFKKISSKDLLLVGGKGSNLGEMLNAGVPVPPGFVVTTKSYDLFLEENGLKMLITDLLSDLNVANTKKLNEASERIENLILEAKMPTEVRQEIVEAYQKMSGFADASVAVRSSATAEDIPGASFAGQQATYLNVKGPRNLTEAVQKCWASLFEPRAIFYRVTKGFDHMSVSIAVPVQKMVQSEVSGVMFTLNPLNNDETKITIESVYGLGETIVSGAVTPDHYIVDKGSLNILEKQISNQEWMLIRRGKPVQGDPNIQVNVSKDMAGRQKLSDKFIKELAKVGRIIETHYKFPQDIEWAFAGNKIWIVQSRPVTTIGVTEEGRQVEEKVEEELSKLTHSMKDTLAIQKKRIDTEKIELNVLLDGVPASPGVVSGKIRSIVDASKMEQLKPGEILVTGMTTPSWVPIMKKASAIITDQGGATAHAAIVSRELGIPCVVGTQIATKVLKTGEWVTIDGSGGVVYEGKLDKDEMEEVVELIPMEGRKGEKQLSDEQVRDLKTATKVYVNLGEPDLASDVSKMYVDGVGLLRAEFMLATFGIHPQSILDDKEKKKAYITHLADGIEEFCKAFGPDRPVVYRATDFKTNEYMALEGGEEFEFEESNPMIGYRGVSRYLENADVFNLELKAIKEVRDKRGYRNLWLMLPFVRTVDELIQAKKIVTTAGLRRSQTFNIFMMVEIPSNVIMIEKFIAAGIDGVSMGTNDLTQLTLGVDRDNPKVQKIFDERDEAVMWSMERVVKACAKAKIKCSICGQAPSVYPEITKKLVEWGVTSVSVNPDMINKTRQIVSNVEKELVRSRSRR